MNKAKEKINALLIKLKELLSKTKDLPSRLFKRKIETQGEQIPEGDSPDVSKESTKERLKERLAEFIKRIRENRSNLLLRLSIIVGVIFVISIGVIIYYQTKVYTGFDVVRRTDRTDTESTKYMYLKDKMIKYSADGVSLIDEKQNNIWTESYNIPEPMIDKCDNTFAIASRDGLDIYVFDESGIIGQFKTDLPILKIKVSNQGVVIVSLDNGDETPLRLYDVKGTEIAAFKTTMSQTGYPMDIDISPDGTKVLISYLGVNGDSVSGNIAVYNFGTVGQTYTDNLVNSQKYDDSVIPQIEFLDGNTALAIRDDGFSVFTGKEILEESRNVSLDGREPVSVFYDKSHVGYIFQAEEVEYKYEICLYDLKGKQILSKKIDTEYQTVKIENQQIVLLNEKECTMYDFKGVQKFHANFKGNIQELFKIKGFRKYSVVQKDRIEEIRLK